MERNGARIGQGTPKEEYTTKEEDEEEERRQGEQ